MMKNIIVVFVCLVLAIGAYFVVKPKGLRVGGSDYYFESTTQATSSVGIYTWTTVLTPNSSLGYTAICDNADGGVNTNNPVYLGFGATSSKPYGFRLASGSCYEIKAENHFNGTLYAIASGSTTTLTTIKK